MSLLKKAKTKFKSKRKSTGSKKMASKQKTKTKRRSFSGARGSFIKKIPILGKIATDRRVQKGVAASGTVELMSNLIQLVPNPTVQNIAKNPLIKTGAAFSIGDVEGAIAQTITNTGGFAQLLQKVQQNGIGGIFGSGSGGSSNVMMANSGAL